MKKIVSLFLCVVFIAALASCGTDPGASQDPGSKDVEKSADASEPDESDVSAESSEPETDESSGPAESSEISEPETSKDITEYLWEYQWWPEDPTDQADCILFYWKEKVQNHGELYTNPAYSELVSGDEIKAYFDTCGLKETSPEFQKRCHYYHIIKKYNVDKDAFKQKVEAERARIKGLNWSAEQIRRYDFLYLFTDEEIDVLFGDDEDAVRRTFKQPWVLYYNGELYHFRELMLHTDEATIKMLWDAGVLEPFADEVAERIKHVDALKDAVNKYKEIKAKYAK